MCLEERKLGHLEETGKTCKLHTERLRSAGGKADVLFEIGSGGRGGCVLAVVKEQACYYFVVFLLVYLNG